MASLASETDRGGVADLPARTADRWRRPVLTISCLCVFAILATAGTLAWHLRNAALARADAEIGKLAHVLAEETARQFQAVDLALVAVEKDLAGPARTGGDFAENVRTDASIDALRL